MDIKEAITALVQKHAPYVTTGGDADGKIILYTSSKRFPLKADRVSTFEGFDVSYKYLGKVKAA